MKKLFTKDIKRRINFFKNEKKIFILNLIFNNFNFLLNIRLKAFLKINSMFKNKYFKTTFSNRCIYSFNKKRFNKLTLFSRNIFLKLIRHGKIHGIVKSSW